LNDVEFDGLVDFEVVVRDVAAGFLRIHACDSFRPKPPRKSDFLRIEVCRAIIPGLQFGEKSLL
jgi:hypothetical protein